jgi:hypothetical protein
MDPGASLGPYTIDRELGAGGMGRVYAATGAEGVVALEVVHPHLLATSSPATRAGGSPPRARNAAERSRHRI